MEELKTVTPRASDGRHKQHLHRRLTEDLGHPKLREHLAAVITAMQLSENYDDFIRKLDRVKPRFSETLPLPLEGPKEKDEPL
jgi:P63C domain.